jgi:dipeptidyl aminopeptidase/acylaminoacyl peptidase
MDEKRKCPYGSWESNITADLIIAESLDLSEISTCGEDVYWLENRPAEQGRGAVVQKPINGKERDVIPVGFSARNSVHEYGGGVYTVNSLGFYFANWEDQRIYSTNKDGSPSALTPPPDKHKSLRYGDLTIEKTWLCCVRERHNTPEESTNDLISISTDMPSCTRILASGQDFYSSPRFSHDGQKICWLSWNHPNMPWDGSELWVADFNGDGTISNLVRVAGSLTESIVQPGWAPDGDLFFFTDVSGYWNLAVWDGSVTRPFLTEPVDHAEAPWQFGYSSYTFLSDGLLVLGVSSPAEPGLLRCFDVNGQELTSINSNYSRIRYLKAMGQQVIYLGSSPTRLPEIVAVNVRNGKELILKKSSSLQIDSESISVPRAIEFSTTDNGCAHAFYYNPYNPVIEENKNEKPPLIVMTHGGPTGAAGAELNLKVQFWTSRGFAVVDVNYRGSTGYGRVYRDALKGMWGIYDMADCVAAADYLVANGLADPDRLIIRGSSAGGYTVINALTFFDHFAAGATYYGIADLEALVHDTHKFESRYMDSLIGPYPDAKQAYHDRSAIHFTDRLTTPMIIFQGLEDAIVPPSQSEKISKALREKRLPFAYMAFEGEGHGFRQARNVKRSLEAELYFYSRVMGFVPADQIEPINIENAELLTRA